MEEEPDIDEEFSLNIEVSEKDSGKGLVSRSKKKLSLKMIIIVSVVFVLIGGVILFFVFLRGGKAEESKIEDDIIKEEVTEVFFADIVKIEIIEIELGDLGGEKAFKVGIAFKIDQQELRDEIIRRNSQIKNTVSILIKSKTYEELQGIDGKILLRNEIVKQLNKILETGRIVNLFFYKYLIL